MNTTYEWLYDNYAEPLLKEIYGSEEKELEELSRELGLTDSGRVQLIDHLTTIRLRWGTEGFALGVQLGVRLTAPIMKET
ncbi:MAG: hypothetical protein HFF67_01700 [Oscillospiraceae bacterium]|jgi:hypothetical protein|nr:hypothetical protein [Oscillospiraceae bacterium]